MLASRGKLRLCTRHWPYCHRVAVTRVVSSSSLSLSFSRLRLSCRRINRLFLMAPGAASVDGNQASPSALGSAPAPSENDISGGLGSPSPPPPKRSKKGDNPDSTKKGKQEGKVRNEPYYVDATELIGALRGTFDAIIDVRSPSEFAEDRVSGSVNCNVMTDEQRAEVGTLYKQTSPFDARKVGAAYVCENTAKHLRTEMFAAAPKSWRPVVYCWRGGERSNSFAHILSRVGYRTAVLRGGYKAYRAAVMERLQTLPFHSNLRFRSLSGPTGSGKTQLLHALRDAGELTLDLEGLANHRGSVLGRPPRRRDVPTSQAMVARLRGEEQHLEPQPCQKRFETLLLDELLSLVEKTADAPRTVWVESEAQKVGDCQVPKALFTVLRVAPRLHLQVPMASRVKHTMREYEHLTDSNPDGPALLKRLLGSLVGSHVSKATYEEWCAMTDAGEWERLVESLLVEHYDPRYNHTHLSQIEGRGVSLTELALDSLEPDAVTKFVAQCKAMEVAPPTTAEAPADAACANGDDASDEEGEDH